MKWLSIMLTLLSATLGFGQTKFGQGYFIDNEGKRLGCLIKAEDWRNNPSKFFYRDTETSDIKSLDVADAKEFGFVAGVRYVRATVDIDYSNDVDEIQNTPDGPLSKISLQREPEWKKGQVVFLQVIVDGKADLFYWYGDVRMRFFYSMNDSTITPLIRKIYLVDRETRLPFETVTQNRSYTAFEKLTNNDFKSQLYEQVNCGKLTMDKVRAVNYDRKDLVDYFLKFNACSGGSTINYDLLAPKREKVHITLRPGINFSSYEIYYPGTFTTIHSTFPTSAGFRLGVEMEYFLQSNANRWSLFTEPTYRSYVAETTRGAATDKIKYNSIELPLGGRYNGYFKSGSKIFLSVAYVLDFALSSEIMIQGIPNREIVSSSNFAFGIGYAVKKLSFEARFFTNRNLQKDFVSIPNSFRNMSVIVGYRLY
jgi:hypothetical protein